MGWKQWPYWMRGGIIGVVTSVIIGLTLRLIDLYVVNYLNPWVAITFIDGVIVGSFIGFVIGNYKGGVSFDNIPEIIMYGIGSIILWFLLGTLIGLIIGKLKSKNKHYKKGIKK